MTINFDPHKPARLPPNPFKLARQHLQMTQQELADQAGVTRQVVVLTEQGLYSQPSPKLVEALSGGVEHRKALLRLSYPTWVQERRRFNAFLFHPVKLELTKAPFWELIVQLARKQMRAAGIASLSHAVVYQRSLLSEYQKYGTGVGSFMAALRDCGLSEANIIYLATNHVPSET